MTAKNKKRLIVISVILFFTWPFLLLLIFTLIPKDATSNNSRLSVEQRLVPLLPFPPAGAVLISEGFSPEARCLDKCGHYDRRFDYSTIPDICTALVQSIKDDSHGYVFGLDYKTTASLTPDECRVELQKYMGTEIIPSFSLNRGRYEIITINIDTNKKQLSYSVEENAELNFNRPQ